MALSRWGRFKVMRATAGWGVSTTTESVMACGRYIGGGWSSASRTVDDLEDDGGFARSGQEVEVDPDPLADRDPVRFPQDPAG